MLALIRQRVLFEFGVFRFLGLEAALCFLRTCRDATVLIPRPRALRLMSAQHLDKVSWDKLESLSLQESPSLQDSASPRVWPAGLRELELHVSGHEPLHRVPLDLQVLVLCFARFAADVSVSACLSALSPCGVHTMQVNCSLDRQRTRLLAQTCPKLRRLVCLRIEFEFDLGCEFPLEALSCTEIEPEEGLGLSSLQTLRSSQFWSTFTWPLSSDSESRLRTLRS
jgi:hypothetical protein